MKYTYRDLIEYLWVASRNGLLKYNTARTRRTAIKRVFASQPDYEERDIFKVDLDVAIHGFKELEANKGVSDSTINTYKSRIKTTIEDFALWLRKRPQQGSDEIQSIMSGESFGSSPRLISDKKIETFSLPVPLESGLKLTIKDIPTNLTENDAEKICEVIKFIASCFKGGDKQEN